jgi:hypothetical protein
MIVDSQYLDELLEDFHRRWPLEKVKQMTLSDYVAVGDPDTFCQWVETKTRELGSIKGMNSSKFGIYKREDPLILPTSFENDEIYSWRKVFGDNRDEVFTNVKAEVIKIIEYAQAGYFHKIDGLELTDFFKWKVAYLYSYERLIPIFTNDALTSISRHFGLKAGARSPYSKIHELIISNKPPHLTIHEYAAELFEKFGSGPDSSDSVTTVKVESKTRKATNSLKFGDYFSNGNKGYVASRKHSEIQQALYNQLKTEFPGDLARIEFNYVDVRVDFKDKIYFYEVKSDTHAGDCIRNALGQLVAYPYKETDQKKNFLYVVGENEPNGLDVDFLNFLNKKYDLNIEYIAIQVTKNI